MIKTKVKIHDKFSFEFKISFIANRKTIKEKNNEFSINTWLFVPNSLDINRATYSKEQFYIDTKSNVRLITPVFTLQEIYTGKPIKQLKKSLIALADNSDSEENAKNYAYQVRMFASICKSAIRDRAYYLKQQRHDSDIQEKVEEYIEDIKNILKRYRELRAIINNPQIDYQLKEYYFFADEFIGNIVEQQLFRLLKGTKDSSVFYEIKNQLIELAEAEIKYKKKQTYPVLDRKDPSKNYLVVMRRGILKKFIESDLYLNIKNTKDGAYAEHFYYGIAAGVSMIFATVIAFIAQSHYGNFTLPLFVALVISYIFKDRIKDLMRYYFSTQLGKKYFDTKRNLQIQNQNIGWAKEAFDFVSEKKVPHEVFSMRKRTPLVEAENRIYNEKIILYRKLVNLSQDKINPYRGYKYIGINDVTRFNLTHFIQKMDNSLVPLYLPDPENGYIEFQGEKVYALVFIIRCESINNLYYKKYRLLFNREGIREISEI